MIHKLLLVWSQICACMFYLNDTTLGERLQKGLCDLQLVEQGAAELRISLNHGKLHVTSAEPAARESLLAVAPNLSVTNCASLLGSPLGSVDCIDQAIYL